MSDYILVDLNKQIKELNQKYLNAVADYEYQHYLSNLYRNALVKILYILNNQIDYKDFSDIVFAINEIIDEVFFK